MPKKKKVLRSMPGSTEPAARQVLKKIQSTKKKAPKKKDTGGKTTAISPRGVRKTPAQGAKEREALRKKQAEKVKKAKAKKKKRNK